MRVGIFGAGPAGLLIAHAARQMGANYIKVFTNGGPSVLNGAQYLHQNIPGIPEIPWARIEHQFKGTIEGYRAKVYGTEWNGIVSPERYTGDAYAWDIRYAYNWLVNEYWDLYVDNHSITGPMLAGSANGFWPMYVLQDRFDMIFSTIPRRVLCMNPDHKFKTAEIYAIGDAPDVGIISPVPCPDNKLICSGDHQDSWYRVSRIFGMGTTEWTANGKKPPVEGIVKVLKPTVTDCTCWPELNYQGRYGKWQKGVLSHDAYREAILAMQRKMQAIA